MSSASREKVIVERRYEAQENACAQALKLLLQKAAGTGGGVEDRARGRTKHLPYYAERTAQETE